MDATELGMDMVKMTKLYYNAGGSLEDTYPKSTELPCMSPKDEMCESGEKSGTLYESARC